MPGVTALTTWVVTGMLEVGPAGDALTAAAAADAFCVGRGSALVADAVDPCTTDDDGTVDVTTAGRAVGRPVASDGSACTDIV